MNETLPRPPVDAATVAEWVGHTIVELGYSLSDSLIQHCLEVGRAVEWVERRAHDFDARGDTEASGRLAGIAAQHAQELRPSGTTARRKEKPSALTLALQYSGHLKRYERLRYLMPGLGNGGAPKLVPQCLRNFYIPAFNEKAGRWRACADCGLDFYAQRRDRQFCSDDCKDRKANRGRQKIGNGQSAAENARRRAGLATTRHMAKCSKEGGPCSHGEFCMALTALLNSSDALAHVAPRVSPDAADRMRGEATILGEGNRHTNR